VYATRSRSRIHPETPRVSSHSAIDGAVERRAQLGTPVADGADVEAAQVARDERGDGRPRGHHLGLAAARAADVPHLAQRVAGAQVVEREAELLRQRADAHVPRVDQLPAQLRDLAVGEVAAQREHAAAHALLRVDDPDGDAGLAEPPRGGQPGDAGADDQHAGVARRAAGARHARRGAGVERRQAGRRAGGGEEAAAREGARLGQRLRHLVERRAQLGGGARRERGAHEEGVGRRARHGRRLRRATRDDTGAPAAAARRGGGGAAQ
jgi:hypothetical protein